MKDGITCLMPFYNEGYRLIETLKVLKNVKGIDKIICINDGSSDNTVKLLNKIFPQITLVTSVKNLGKTGAIRLGLKSVKTTHVFLLDVDLINLKPREVESGIRLINKNPDIDILIFQRVKESRFVRFMRFDTILSGQRIIKTNDLNTILKKDISRYDLEVVMNEYINENHLKVSISPIAVINSRRIDKWGLKQSVYTNVAMFSRFTKYPGIVKFAKQILYFGKS